MLKPIEHYWRNWGGGENKNPYIQVAILNAILFIPLKMLPYF